MVKVRPLLKRLNTSTVESEKIVTIIIIYLRVSIFSKHHFEFLKCMSSYGVTSHTFARNETLKVPST